MTSATRPIWIVHLKDTSGRNPKGVVINYAAHDLIELLSYFSEEGKKNILAMEKTEQEVTYHY